MYKSSLLPLHDRTSLLHWLFSEWLNRNNITHTIYIYICIYNIYTHVRSCRGVFVRKIYASPRKSLHVIVICYATLSTAAIAMLCCHFPLPPSLCMVEMRWCTRTLAVGSLIQRSQDMARRCTRYVCFSPQKNTCRDFQTFPNCTNASSV